MVGRLKSASLTFHDPQPDPTMNLSRNHSVTTLCLLAVSFLPALAAEPDADQLLRQMSSKLAAAGTFRVQATREIDGALLEGRDVPEKAKVTAAVQRPYKLAAISKSNHGVRRMIADGTQLTLLDERTNHYSVVPMRTTIDGLVERMDQRYGFTPPLAEFALSNPYQDLKRNAKTITYLGRGKTTAGFLGLFGVECHRIALHGREAYAELWIGVNDQLPYQLTATFHRAGNPQVRVSFSKWHLNAPVSASEFTFTPPKNSQKIEMWTTDQMRSAVKR
jgi:hypothetical protein